MLVDVESRDFHGALKAGSGDRNQSVGGLNPGPVVHGLEGGLVGLGLGLQPVHERLDLGQAALGLGVDDVIGEVDGRGGLERDDEASGVQVGLGQGALGQGDAAAVGGGFDHQAGLV